MRRLAFVLAFLCTPAIAAPPTVSVRPLSAVAIQPEREAPAQVVSLNRARIPAEVAARIREIPAEPGQRIARGAVLARLDCTDLQLAEQRASAQFEAARAREAQMRQQVGRSRELAAAQFISPDALELRETELKVAQADTRVQQAALAAARREVEKCTVRAPFPAIVEARLAQVGEFAAPGTPLVELTDTSRLQLAARIQAADADTLGDTLSFESQGQRFPVRLVRLSPALDPATRTREARLRFAGRAPAPGSFGVLRWQDTRAWLPADYVLRRGQSLGVFVLEGNTARFRVLAGAQEGRPALAAGLPADSRIVTEGRFALSDGMTVSVR